MIDPKFSLRLILIALAMGVMIQWFIPFFVRKIQQHIHFKDSPFRFDPLFGPVRFLIPVLMVSLTLPLLNLPQDLQNRFAHFIQILIILGLGWFLTKVVRVGREAILFKYNLTNNFNFRRIYTQISIIEHVINFLIYVITLALMIMTFTQAKEIGISFFASAGVMSIIVGLAAQKTLGNLMAGIQIAIAQPIRLDDSVIVEGEWGWVEEITLTYVVIRLWDLRRLVVPISYFLEKPFQNWTRSSSELLGTVFLYVDFTVPVGMVRQELTRILEQSSRWDKKVNGLQVTDVKEKTVELRALISASDAGKLWDLRCEVREKLLEFLKDQYPGSLPRVRVEASGTFPT
jgi:small-conductance mechanosensitive channel